MSAFEADDWARSKAMPSEEEISRVRRLINRSRRTWTTSRTKNVPRSKKPTPWSAAAAQ
ncbi:hypothetical protein ACFXOD_36110 [Streptomyces sp. NPDC059161]|uniref:hypothetical protein n=1 Tax=Streptomyces sp. NPDC059161 TaxID=3346749 RepID=UPI0036C7BAC8